MKKIILIVLSVISYYAYAETNTKVYNNYLIFLTPEYSPHSRPIKKQEISSNITTLDSGKFLDGDISISSNNNGLVTFYQNNEYSSVSSVDYDNKSFTYIISRFTEDKSKIVFNSNDEIKKILSLNRFKNERNYSYDNHDRLAKGVTTYNILGVTSTTEFYYTNENLVESIFEKRTHKTGSSSRTIKFIYDNNNRLIETIRENFLKSDTTENQNAEIDKTIHCFFEEHNEYGDWTKGYCVENKKNLGYFKREIEY